MRKFLVRNIVKSFNEMPDSCIDTIIEADKLEYDTKNGAVIFYKTLDNCLFEAIAIFREYSSVFEVFGNTPSEIFSDIYPKFMPPEDTKEVKSPD